MIIARIGLEIAKNVLRNIDRTGVFARLFMSAFLFSSVTATAQQITVSPTSVGLGGTATVTVSGGPANPTDWVGLFEIGGDNSDRAWLYLSGTQSPYGPGKSSATLTFAMPSSPGQYQFRFYANNAYTLLATSGTVNVGAVNVTPQQRGDNLTQPIPATLFGMHIAYLSDFPTVSIGTLGKAACTGWKDIQPTRGVYNWQTLDQAVDLAQSNGIDTYYAFYSVPSWAASDTSQCVPSGCSASIKYCESMPTNLSDFTNFVTALVTRYRGKIQTYDLWNEPWAGTNSTPGGRETPAQMATLTTAAYNIIRAIDPAAQITSPDLDATTADTIAYMNSYFAAGGPTDVDIVSIHASATDSGTGYCPAAMPESSINYDGYDNGGYQLTYILPTINQYLPGRPIWNTEGSVNIEISDPCVGTYDTAAAFVSRWYIMHWAAGINRNYWYWWDSYPEPLMPSLVGSSEPASAYQQTYNWLVGNTMYQGCSTGRDGVTWTCPLAGPTGYTALIVWDTAGDESYTPPSPSLYARYRDLSGNVTPYFGGGVTVGIKPILFEN